MQKKSVLTIRTYVSVGGRCFTGLADGRCQRCFAKVDNALKCD